MRLLLRLVRLAPLVVFSPLALIASVVAFAIENLAWKVFGRGLPPTDTRPSTAAASVVIPNWNGRE